MKSVLSLQSAAQAVCVGVALFVGGGALLGMAEESKSPKEPKGPQAPAASQPATQPAKQGTIHKVVLKDLEGKDLPLSKYADKPMIIEVWATTCGPCLKQRKVIHSVIDKLNEHAYIIAASVDTSSDKVKTYLKNNKADGVIEAMCTPDLRKAMRAKNPGNTIPKVLYVSGRGEILEITGGGQTAEWLIARAKSLK
jgi:thiol-disulfide isomerase/thioredoxin